jgi:hypothetical protein
VSADTERARNALTVLGFEFTRVSAERTDRNEALRRIVAMWDDLAAGRHVEGDDAKSLIEHARRLVEDNR